MNPFVPTDLLDIPAITYFKFRNNGAIIDPIEGKAINRYMKFYQKSPREIFDFKGKTNFRNLKWTPVKFPQGFQLSRAVIETPYKPILSQLLKSPKFRPVKQIQLQRYQNKKREERKTATLFIHGYAESTFFLHEQSYFRIFDRILRSDVFTLELPHHHTRQPTDSPFSGAYYLNGNPIRMLEAFRQSVQEICVFTNYLKQAYDDVLLFGVSLGGHLTALASQFLDSVRIVSALASPFLFRLNPKIAPVSRMMVSQLKEKGFLSWYKILYACNMKYYSPFTTNEKTAIIGGRYDRIVPFPQVQKLAKMIQKPLFGYPGGHISVIFWLWPLLRKIIRYFDSEHQLT